jgi:hypothetical protein
MLSQSLVMRCKESCQSPDTEITVEIGDACAARIIRSPQVYCRKHSLIQICLVKSPRVKRSFVCLLLQFSYNWIP